MSLSGDGRTLAVGANLEASDAMGIGGEQDSDPGLNDPGLEAGAVYMFNLNGSSWSQQAYVKASNTRAGGFGDQFGRALALSADGDTLAVGTPFEDSSAVGIDGDQADDSTSHSGAVYVY